jgi:hypothetical protein
LKQVIVVCISSLKEAPAKVTVLPVATFSSEKVAVPPVGLKHLLQIQLLNVIQSYNCTIVAVINFVVCRE